MLSPPNLKCLASAIPKILVYVITMAEPIVTMSMLCDFLLLNHVCFDVFIFLNFYFVYDFIINKLYYNDKKICCHNCYFINVIISWKLCKMDIVVVEGRLRKSYVTQSDGTITSDLKDLEDHLSSL